MYMHVWGETSDKTKHLNKLIDWLEDTTPNITELTADDAQTLAAQAKRICPYEDEYLTHLFDLLKQDLPPKQFAAQLKSLAAFYRNPIQTEPIPTFEKQRFVLTGDFRMEGGKESAAELITKAGGRVTKAISNATCYVVVGALGNDVYAFKNYGTKVKTAANMQLNGHKIRSITEDALIESLRATSPDALDVLDQKSARFDAIWKNAEAVDRNFSGLTAGQQEVFDLVKEGKNVYLTGLGGTGKSYILQRIITWARSVHKNVVVTAPTGIAALNVHGSTIHRALGIRPGAAYDPEHSIYLDKDDPLFNCDLMIIDEISMCRMDLFDLLSRTLRRIKTRRAREGKDLCQMLVVGDFCQLPPVLPRTDGPILKQFYPGNLDGAYAFMGREWSKWNFNKVELTQAIRQRDVNFVAALNAVRAGDVRGVRWIEKHASTTPAAHAIRLCGRNAQADEVNEDELDKLKGRTKTYYASISGQVTRQDMPVADALTLKVGARVMSVVNSSVYFNGSLGTVNSLDKDSVVVDFDGVGTATVKIHTFEVVRPSLEDGQVKQETIGSITQLPLKLAWAITIHKSQGQTFDAAHIYPECWDAGQLYTALSRLSNIDGLSLAHPINESFLKTSPEVIKFLEGDYVAPTWDKPAK